LQKVSLRADAMAKRKHRTNVFSCSPVHIVSAFIRHQGTVLCSGILLRQGSLFAIASARRETFCKADDA
jgi:hypothetical protein